MPFYVLYLLVCTVGTDDCRWIDTDSFLDKAACMAAAAETLNKHFAFNSNSIITKAGCTNQSIDLASPTK